MILIGLMGVLLFFIFVGFPVILSIAIAAIGGIILDPTLVLAMFAHRMFATLDSFSLLAMPYFILAGALMSRGGMSGQLVEFADSLVGHMRGGLAKSGVLSSMLFANLSGSATADTAAIGSVIIPPMSERGYKPGFAAALIASAGTMAPVIPPSLTMIIYGSIAGVSIGGLFMAGILPGLLIGVGLLICVHLLSYSKRYPEMKSERAKSTWRDVFVLMGRIWAALLTPVIILGGILGGFFTATEAGIVTCIYAFIISAFVYRSLGLRDIPSVVIDAAMIAGTVLGILAVAGAFGWLLSYNNFARSLVGYITAITGEGQLVLAILLGIMLLLTMFVESLAVLIVMIPVAVEVTNRFGLDPFHVGVLMVVVTQIGAVTPPVAVLLFVASRIAKTSVESAIRESWPMLLTLFAVLAILFFIPGLSTWIPRAVFG